MARWPPAVRSTIRKWLVDGRNPGTLDRPRQLAVQPLGDERVPICIEVTIRRAGLVGERPHATIGRCYEWLPGVEYDDAKRFGDLPHRILRRVCRQEAAFDFSPIAKDIHDQRHVVGAQLVDDVAHDGREMRLPIGIGSTRRSRRNALLEVDDGRGKMGG